jgi:hypothetical protein
MKISLPMLVAALACSVPQLAAAVPIHATFNGTVSGSGVFTNLTHAQAAELAGTSRSRMTAILNGNVLDVSTDLLLRILAALGLRAKVTFSRAA